MQLNQLNIIDDQLVPHNATPRLTIRTEVNIVIGGGRYEGTFITFNGFPDGREHFAIALGAPPAGGIPLVRLHSECMTGDTFGSQFCDCGPQLDEAIGRIAEEGGYLLYLRQEGRGIGLYSKLDAYALQRKGLDTFEANRHLKFADDLRNYLPAALMLKALGAPQIRLLSNNPDKAAQLHRDGITVAEQVRTGVFINPHNLRYLSAKQQKSAHTLDVVVTEGIAK